MFTNGHHQSSTHVARAISRHTRKIKERHKENRGKWNISAGDCRSTTSLQTMLSTQSFVIVGSRCTPRLRKHTLSCLLYTIGKISKKGNYSFLYEKKNFEMEIDQMLQVESFFCFCFIDGMTRLEILIET